MAGGELQANDSHQQQRGKKEAQAGERFMEYGDSDDQQHPARRSLSRLHRRSPAEVVLVAWDRKKKLANIPSTVKAEKPSLLKPSDNFKKVAQKISNPPASIKKIHAMFVPSSDK